MPRDYPRPLVNREAFPSLWLLGNWGGDLRLLGFWKNGNPRNTFKAKDALLFPSHESALRWLALARHLIKNSGTPIVVDLEHFLLVQEDAEE